VTPSVLPAAAPEWQTARGTLSLQRPLVLGVVNVTPDSFWDGGRHASPDAALAHAERLVDEGADLLDVGGESTRPGANRVPADVEIRRVVPLVEALVARWPATPVSVDTTKAVVARAALDAGAAVINDVSGLRLDAALAGVVAARGAGIIVMHSRGGIEEMASYALARYGSDVVGEVVAELGEAVARAAAAGIARGQIVADPGLGFAKRTEHSAAVLARLDRFARLGCPLLLGPSRKRFIGDLGGGLPPESRLEGTLAVCVIGLLAGARLFRVHDVAAARRALDVAEAIRTART
jgi:dihydropteroate synthase